MSAPLSSSRAVSDSAIRVCAVFLQHFVTLSPTCVNLAAFSESAIRALELVLSTRAVTVLTNRLITVVWIGLVGLGTELTKKPTVAI